MKSDKGNDSVIEGSVESAFVQDPVQVLLSPSISLNMIHTFVSWPGIAAMHALI